MGDYVNIFRTSVNRGTNEVVLAFGHRLPKLLLKHPNERVSKSEGVPEAEVTYVSNLVMSVECAESLASILTQVLDASKSEQDGEK